MDHGFSFDSFEENDLAASRPRKLKKHGHWWYISAGMNYETTMQCRRYAQARRLLKKERLTYRDRFGAPRKHPAVTIEFDAARTLATILKRLGLPENEGPTR